jgi:hypothetical protein
MSLTPVTRITPSVESDEEQGADPPPKHGLTAKKSQSSTVANRDLRNSPQVGPVLPGEVSRP